MPFIEVEGLNESYEDQVVPEGEYELRVTAAQAKRNKADTRDMILAVCAIEGSDVANPRSVFYNMNFPNKDDSADGRRLMMQAVTRFLKHFDIAFEANGINPEDMVGATASCLLKQEEIEGTDGEMRNIIVLPALD